MARQRPLKKKEEAAAEPASEPLSAVEAACAPRERAFVHHLMTLKPERGFKVQAARLAGYRASTAHNMNSLAQRLLKSPRVVALIAELTPKRIHAMAPNALEAYEEILADRDHKDRHKIATSVLERISPTVQRHDINVRHEIVDRDKDMVAYLRKLLALGVSREKLIEELGYSDLPRYERLLALEDASKSAGPVIDADYAVIKHEEAAE
jgi:phage terminase small subunit